jgi:hypothetical protein
MARNSPVFAVNSRFSILAGVHFAHSCAVWRHLCARKTCGNRPNSTFLVRILRAKRFLPQHAIDGRFRPPTASRKSLCGSGLRNVDFRQTINPLEGWCQNVFRIVP